MASLRALRTWSVYGSTPRTGYLQIIDSHMIYCRSFREDDLYDLCDLAHVAGWEPYNLHDLLFKHIFSGLDMQLLRGGIVNRTYDMYKNLPGVHFPTCTAINNSNIWYYLLWSPVILLCRSCTTSYSGRRGRNWVMYVDHDPTEVW